MLLSSGGHRAYHRLSVKEILSVFYNDLVSMTTDNDPPLCLYFLQSC